MGSQCAGGNIMWSRRVWRVSWGPSVQVGVMESQCACRGATGVCVIYFHLHTGTPLLLPAHWDPMLLLPAHWHPVVLLPAHWPHYSYLHTETLWYFHLHTGTSLLLPAHWVPVTPTCTLRPCDSYLHTGTPSLLPAYWDPTIQLPAQWQNRFSNITTLFITS